MFVSSTSVYADKQSRETYILNMKRFDSDIPSTVDMHRTKESLSALRSLPGIPNEIKSKKEEERDDTEKSGSMCKLVSEQLILPIGANALEMQHACCSCGPRADNPSPWAKNFDVACFI